jgi:hypothetical protein
VVLFASVILERHLEAVMTSLDQFRDDIDDKKENSPDANSLEDFFEFALDVHEICTSSIAPITISCSTCPMISPVCEDAVSTVSSFVDDIRKLAESCSLELCRSQLPDGLGRPLVERLAALQELDIKKRKRQFSLVRPVLNEMQIAARHTREIIERDIDRLREAAGKMRGWLQQIEQICNLHGNLHDEAVISMIREIDSPR